MGLSKTVEEAAAYVRGNGPQLARAMRFGARLSSALSALDRRKVLDYLAREGPSLVEDLIDGRLRLVREPPGEGGSPSGGGRRPR